MPDIKEIMEKVDKGEALTEEEKLEIMSVPHEDPDQVDDSQDEKNYQERLESNRLAKEAGEEIETEESETDEESENAQTSEANDEKTDDADDKQGSEKDAGKKPDNTDKSEENKSDETDEGSGNLDKELEKPDGEEDLTQLNSRERGLFYNLRAERRKRQDAERELDNLKFQKLKEKQEAEEEEEPDDGDFLNKEQVDKRVGREIARIEAQHRKQMTQVWVREAANEYADFDAVVDIGQEIIQNNREHQDKIADAYAAGENPALVTYDLIKNDPAFAATVKKHDLVLVDGVVRKQKAPKPEGETQEGKKKPDAEDVAKAKKIQENAKKTPITGTGGGGDDDNIGELSLSYVRSLSEAEFERLPAKKRQAILEKFG